jgi:hypothetical protein
MENVTSASSESLSPFENFISNLNKITEDLKTRNEEIKNRQREQRKNKHNHN